MKKPYIKKIGEFSGYKVFYVNGYWIRKNLDKAFTNFGYNFHFDFIPKGEFWIDWENGKKEAKYFIDSFLAIQCALEDGKSYEQAVKEADKFEQRERSKSKFLKKLKKLNTKKEILKKIHKKRLFKEYTQNIQIWIVRGDLVRSLFHLDFTQGGHDLVYNFIPKNEVWIDDDIYRKEIPFVLIHELHERRLMLKGWSYDDAGGQEVFMRNQNKKGKSAHFHAEDLEFWCRHHPKKVHKILVKEIKMNENLSEVKKK